MRRKTKQTRHTTKVFTILGNPPAAVRNLVKSLDWKSGRIALVVLVDGHACLDIVPSVPKRYDDLFRLWKRETAPTLARSDVRCFIVGVISDLAVAVEEIKI